MTKIQFFWNKVSCRLVNNYTIKLVIGKSLYYDARSENHQHFSKVLNF